MLKDAEIAVFRQALLDERAELLSNAAMSTDDRSTVMLDQQSVGRLSRMDAMQRQAMAQATERRRQARETRITAALERMDTREYGFCLDCGEDIGRRRLELDPTLPTCISCARS